MILSTRRMQFFNPIWHILPENPKHSRSVSEKKLQKFFMQEHQFSKQWSSVILEHIFEHHKEKKTPESKKVFARSPKNFTKLFLKCLYLQ